MDIVLPGSMIHVNANGKEVELLEGLYEHEGSIYASRAGILCTENHPNNKKLLLKVTHKKSGSRAILPQVGQIIIGTVSKVTSRYIGVDIQVVDQGTGAIFFEEFFKGTLRSQDVWPAEDKDAPSQLYIAMRPGDLIRARIIGMGDASAGFLLSTSVEEALGVVFARCAATGLPMAPISWNEMICPQSGIKETRKPARPKQL